MIATSEVERPGRQERTDSKPTLGERGHQDDEHHRRWDEERGAPTQAPIMS